MKDDDVAVVISTVKYLDCKIVLLFYIHFIKDHLSSITHIVG